MEKPWARVEPAGDVGCMALPGFLGQQGLSTAYVCNWPTLPSLLVPAWIMDTLVPGTCHTCSWSLTGPAVGQHRPRAS